MAALYGDGNYRKFLEEMSESSLPPEFFIESNVYEFLKSPANEEEVRSIWSRNEIGYVINSSFFDCLAGTTESRDLIDIINATKEVPDVSPSLLASLLLEIVQEKEAKSDEMKTFIAVAIFCQKSLSIELSEKNSDNEGTYSDDSLRGQVSPGGGLYKGDSIISAVDVDPEFEGGLSGFYNYVASHIVYPKEARRLGVEGKVFVQFLVASDGAVDNVEIIQGIGYGCDSEVVRVVESSPKWKPGLLRNKPVVVRIILPINFHLSDDEGTS